MACFRLLHDDDDDDDEVEVQVTITAINPYIGGGIHFAGVA